MKLKRFVLQAKVEQKYTNGRPLVWRLVDSFDTYAEAAATMPPNRPGEFRILDRESLKSDFGARFRAICREKGLTPSEAAKICGYSHYMGTYFSREVQLPREKTLERLSKGLDVSIQRLVGKEKNV